MANYVSKVWEDAIFPNPTRYLMRHEDNTEEYVTLVNAFGTPTQSGDVFDAATFNNMEGRINSGFGSCIETLAGTTPPTASEGKNGDTYFQTETTGGETTIVGMFVKVSGEWLEVSVGGSTLPQAEGSGF